MARPAGSDNVGGIDSGYTRNRNPWTAWRLSGVLALEIKIVRRSADCAAGDSSIDPPHEPGQPDIGEVRIRLAAVATNVIDDFLRLTLVGDVIDDDMSARSTDRQRNCPANSRIGTGNESPLAVDDPQGRPSALFETLRISGRWNHEN